MHPSRTMMVKALTACEAAVDGGDIRTCPVFAAAPFVFGSGSLSSAVMAKTGGTLLVVNQTLRAIAVDDVVMALQDVSGHWIIADSASSVQMIQFSLVNNEYGADAPVPAKCSERQTTDNYSGEVVRVVCGGTRPVYGEDYEGIVELRDDIGFLEGRDFRALNGKLGIAVLLKPENDYEDCYWCIVSIDFHRTIQVLSDFIVTETGFTIERKNISVWDDCDLDDEEIEGAVCEDEYYDGGGGI